MPKYQFVNFWDPKGKYFWTLSNSCNINYDFEKYSSIILATICQRFRHFNPSVCIPKYPFVNFWEPKVTIFLVWQIHVTLTINMKKITQYDLNFGGGVVGGLNERYPPPHHPQNLSHIYDSLTFMFECQGWGGEGVVISHLTPHHPTPLI